MNNFADDIFAYDTDSYERDTTNEILNDLREDDKHPSCKLKITKKINNKFIPYTVRFNPNEDGSYKLNK